MLPRHLTLCLLGVIALLASVGVASDPPAEKKPPVAKPPTPAKEEPKRPTTVEEFAELTKGAPLPPWLPFRGQDQVRDERIEGTVVSVSREAIEVLPEGKKEAVKYPPHTLLDTGAICHWERDSRCYLLDDVQKGDVVLIGVGIPERGAEMQCFYVTILKRPNGVVPASRKPSSPPAYHQNQQAKIDHAEKGTPLPDHLQEKGGPPKKKPVTPPVGDPPPKKDEKSKEKKRPTTEAEFEALAKEGPKPPWIPFIGTNTLLPDKVRGTVVAVSADAIEVRPEGKKETVKYPPHTLLATGAVCHWEGDAYCYLLDDVQKGDEVMVAVGTVDKEKGPEAWYLTIKKRPGGVVPASRKPSYPNAYHLRRQEQVEADERGGLTPQDIKDDIEKRKLAAEKGLPPPPPLKPPENPPKKKD